MKTIARLSALFRAATIALLLCGTQLPAWAQEFTKTPVGDVVDVAVTDSDLIYIVNSSGELLWSFDSGQTFQPTKRGNVSRVAAGPKRAVWIVDKGGKVWTLRNQVWIQTDQTGMADVAASPNGEVACCAAEGGAVWLSTDGVTFTQGPDAHASRLSYDPRGTLWAVSTDTSVWEFGRGKWIKTSTDHMRDVAAGPRIVWFTDLDGVVWVSHGAGGLKKTASAGFQNIAVARDGIGWGAGYNGSLWRIDANGQPKPPAGPIGQVPAPAPKKPAPPPAPPVKQAIRNVIEPPGEGNGRLTFKFNTVLPVIAIVEIGRRAPDYDKGFLPGDFVTCASSAGGTAHTVHLSGLKVTADYQYRIIAGNARVVGTCSTHPPYTF
jgi:hypothetical protein